MADDRDDDQWLDGIAGRGAASREADAVRAALLQKERELPLSAQELEGGLQRLLFRLKRDGLLARSRAAANWSNWAMAASLAVVIGAVGWIALAPKQDEDEIGFRGGAVQEISAAEPARTADAIAQELRALGITVVRRDSKGASLVEALVQNRDDPRLAETLGRYRLKPGESGPLQVRIVPLKK